MLKGSDNPLLLLIKAYFYHTITYDTFVTVTNL